MKLLIEMIVDWGVNRDKFLQTSHFWEAQHGSLSSSKRNVCVFGPIIGPTARLLTFIVATLAALSDRPTGLVPTAPITSVFAPKEGRSLPIFACGLKPLIPMLSGVTLSATKMLMLASFRLQREKDKSYG